MINNKPIVATLGGHSALEIFAGAKKHGFNTLALVVKGRDKTYTKHFANLCDENFYLDSFANLLDKNVISKLAKKETIFIPHRYVQVYCDLLKFENNFKIPVFGNKYLLKYENREGNYNQYSILKKAKASFPLQFNKPENIDRLSIVKANEKVRSYERSFFFANNFSDYKKQAKVMIKRGKIKDQDLKTAVIEEYLVGV